MKQSKRRYFSGNSLGQAVTAAACEYDLAPAEVAYKPVEKRHGFLRSRKRFLIEVDPEAPRREPPATASEEPAAKTPTVAPPRRPPAAQRAPAAAEALPAEERKAPAPRREPARPPEEPPEEEALDEEFDELEPEDAFEPDEDEPDDDELDDEPDDDELDDDELDDEEPDDEPFEGTVAEQAVDQLLSVLGLELTAEVSETAEGVDVLLEGADAELLIEDDGKALFAFEHLLPKIIRGLSGERVLCHVDAAGFRAKRQTELETLAREAAAEVRASGEPKTLEPLNPAERRIVHMALADDEEVETESEGSGFVKRLTIWPR